MYLKVISDRVRNRKTLGRLFETTLKKVLKLLK
jgi:hypothetical protein